MAQEDYKDVAAKLIPYMEAMGLSKFNIHWEDGRLLVDLPVLRKKADKSDFYDPKAEEVEIPDISDSFAPSSREQSSDEITSVGQGVFGEIYDAFKGKVKEAIGWLFGKKSGEAKGVFYREGIGEIGLIWGNSKGGLEHIIEKHIIEHSDYDSVAELSKVIEDVIINGDFIVQKGGNIRFEKGSHRVIVAKNESGDFVVTAYDNSRNVSEKKRTEADATLFRQRVLEEMNGAPVSSSSGSERKDNKSEIDKQNSGEDSEDGEPDYESMDPSTAWDALVAQTEGDEEMALTIAEEQRADRQSSYEAALEVVADIEGEIEAAKKQSAPLPEGYKQMSIAEQIRARKEAKADVAAKVAEIEGRLAEARQSADMAEAAMVFWEEIAKTKQLRQEAAAKAERQRRDAEARAEAERMRKEKEELSGIPDMAEDTPAAARARGARKSGGKIYRRQEPIVEKLEGKEVTVDFNEKKKGHQPKARLVVMEASQLQPSHLEGERNPMFFIDEAQPKDRTDVESILAERRHAAEMDPGKITDWRDTVDPFRGSPTVNSRGEVIQGNHRGATLRYMYANEPASMKRYRQYLIDHAADFGLTEEQAQEIAWMEEPVLVNMVDVEDAMAIELGLDTGNSRETGGKDRIDVDRLATGIGDKMGRFMDTLLSDEGAEDGESLRSLIRRNGLEALKFLRDMGKIDERQYATAIDRDGSLTDEGVDDIEKFIRRSFFAGESREFEEKFAALPSKAQGAILAQSWRDTKTAEADKLTPHIKEAVNAFYEMLAIPSFKAARNIKEALLAVETWKAQTVFNEDGEIVSNKKKYSNFALRLAAMMKGATMRETRGVLKQMLDWLQGGSNVGGLLDMMEEPTEAEVEEDRSFRGAVRKVLGMEYEGGEASPILVETDKKKNDGTNGSADVAGTDKGESQRQRGSRADAPSRERDPNPTGTADSGRRIRAEVEEETEKPTFLDAVKTLYSKGKAAASKLFNRSFFDVVKTPEFMKEYGLTGDKFTIRFGVISRHFGKDSDHKLPEEIWQQLPDALQNPFAITKHYERKDGKPVEKGYRIYTSLRHNDKYVIVGADVKNVGRGIEINAIETAFAITSPSELEALVYKSENITPDQQSLLDGRNSHQYPAEREFSDRKVTNSASDKQGEDDKSSDGGGSEWAGSIDEMPSTPGLRQLYRDWLWERGREAFEKMIANHNDFGAFVSGVEADRRKRFEEFKELYKDAVTETAFEATQEHLSAVFEHFYNKMRQKAESDQLKKEIEEMSSLSDDYLRSTIAKLKGEQSELPYYDKPGAGLKFDDKQRIIDRYERELERRSSLKQDSSEKSEEKKKGFFGEIFDSFRGKVKEAFDFLIQQRTGDLLGVFHREDVGDIDLVWGDKEGGLDHIIERHVGEGKDFASFAEARDVIEDVINHGSIVKERWDKIIIEKDGKRVVIRKNLRDKEGNVIDKNKNWVVTSYDSNIPKSQKKRPTSARATPGSDKGGRAVAPGVSPTDKGNTLSDKKQEVEDKSSDRELTEQDLTSIGPDSGIDESLIDGARDYINGDRDAWSQMCYQTVKNYVRNTANDSGRGSRATDAPQLAGADAIPSRGGIREEGSRPGEMDGADGTENMARDGERGENPAGSDGAISGTGSPDNAGAQTPGTDAQHSDSGDTGRSGGSGSRRGNVRKPKGDKGGKSNARTDGERDASSRGTARPEAGVTRGEETAQSMIDDALDTLRDIFKNPGMTEPGRLNDVTALLAGLGVNAVRFLGATAKLGCGLVLKGFYKYAKWRGEMHRQLDPLLHEHSDLTDDQIAEYIRSAWDMKMSYRGVRKKVSEWAAELEAEELRKMARMSIEEKRKLQAEAEGTSVVIGNLDNIRETLPFLLPAQHEDVEKAERQLFSAEHADRDHGFGKGYLFTNGTGTGKTYTGLGIAKRFLKQGKGRILIVTVNDTKINDWIKDASNLGIEARQLEDTKSKGKGVVVTQYANLRQNFALLEDEFDLIIYDESHKLMENQHGAVGNTARMHHLLANRDAEAVIEREIETSELGEKRRQNRQRIEHLNELFSIAQKPASLVSPEERKKIIESGFRSEEDLRKAISEAGIQEEKYTKEIEDKIEAALNDQAARERAEEISKKTKTVFLSATPFNTPSNLDYAEGYIFSYPEGKPGEGRKERRNGFLRKNFGKSYRVNSQGEMARMSESQITDPEGVEEEEINFSNHLQDKLQTMSGRMLDSAFDYSRTFPQFEMPEAKLVNAAMSEINNGPLRDFFKKTLLDYNYSTAFWEIIKTHFAIPRIREHIALGRKVVIFHRRKDSSQDIRCPFAKGLEAAMEAGEVSKNAALTFARKYADLLAWEASLDYSYPQDRILNEFISDEERAAFDKAHKEWEKKRDEAVRKGKRPPREPKLKSKRVGIFNGDETKNEKQGSVDNFNAADSGQDIIVVQVQSGKEGISLHDTDGRHQRVMMSLALPQSPIEFIQAEGRIYRVGNMSDAIFEYPLLGIDRELYDFAIKINGRSQTSENHAMGSRSRGLRDSITRGALGSMPMPVTKEQGKGGKMLDSRQTQQATGFDHAMSNWKEWRDKETSLPYEERSIPDPLGVKLMEWAGLERGETVLVAYAGEGSAARYAPQSSKLIALESDGGKLARLAALLGGGGRKILGEAFMTDDRNDPNIFSTVNKADVVVVKTRTGNAKQGFSSIKRSILDIKKAIDHTEDSGRVIAIVPTSDLKGVDGILKSVEEWRKYYGTVTRTIVNLPADIFGQEASVIVIDKNLEPSIASANASKGMQRLEVKAGQDVETSLASMRDMAVEKREVDHIAKAVKRVKKVLAPFMNSSLVRSERGMQGKKQKMVHVSRNMVSVFLRRGIYLIPKNVQPSALRYDGLSIYFSKLFQPKEIEELANKWAACKRMSELSSEEFRKEYRYEFKESLDDEAQALLSAFCTLIEAATGKTATQLQNISEGKVENEIKNDMSLEEFMDVYKTLDSGSEEIDELARRVFATAKQIEGLSFRMASGEVFSGHNVMAHYAPAKNAIELNMDAFNSIRFTDAQKAQCILHETIHAVTCWAYARYKEADPAERAAMGKIGEACADIESVYKSINNESFRAALQAGSQLRDNANYGLTDEYEMLAEMSNPVFRAALKTKRLWRQLVNGIKKLFGIDVTEIGEGETTAFDTLNRAISTILENFDPEAYRHYQAAPSKAEYNNAVMSSSRSDFDARRDRAVAERGIVAPGLAEKEVRVVSVPRHDFNGTGKEALKKAERWAKENIVGVHTATDSEGVEFEYSISGDSVEKYVSKSATGKSANIGVHLAALKKLPEIISESIESEIHPDYTKNDADKRIGSNPVNPKSLIHRFYGAVKIEGKLYRVKTTIREYGDKNMLSTAHSYEVTQIELLEAPSDNNLITVEHVAMTSKSSIPVANLLKGVEKSYDPGKKLLEESQKIENEEDDIRYSIEEDDDLLYRPREKEAPKKTRKVYKLMRLKDGKLYPLFIDAAASTELGVWYDADSPNLDMLRGLEAGVYVVDQATGKVQTREEFNETHPELAGKKKTKYPSKEAINWATDNGVRWVEIEETAKEQRRFGENRKYWNLGINGSGSVSTFSMRPGWHAGSLPSMRQIGKGANKDLRDDSFVWVEGEVSADVDYNNEASQNPDKDMPDRIPEDGFYMKATNADKAKSQADRIGWYVAGAFRANRIISDAEARSIIDAHNAEHPEATVEYDYPRESGKDFTPTAEMNASAVMRRDGDGAKSVYDISMENDPLSKAWGESLRNKKQQKTYAERERKRMRSHIEGLQKRLGLKITVLESAEGLTGRKAKAKGWYDKRTGEITLILGNHVSAEDIEATILHEAVAHKGLRKLLGKHFDEFLDKVYEAAERSIKESIDYLATRNGWNRRVATEEYLASLAEQTDFELRNDNGTRWINKIKQYFLDMLFRFGFRHIGKETLSDNELRYILWRSYQNLVNPGRFLAFEWEAADVTMRDQLGIDQEREASEEEEENSEDNDLFRDGDFTPHDRRICAGYYERMLSRGSFQFREAMQDSMLSLRKLYEAVLGKGTRMEDIPGYENAYLYENRMSSTNAAEQHLYFEERMKPLLEAVNEICGNGGRRQRDLERRILTDYMMAKHGLERNARMRAEAANNDEDTDRDFAGLCGLTGEKNWQDAEAAAQQMVDDYEAAYDPVLVAEIWIKTKEATSAILSKLWESGILSEDRYNEILAMYDYYIPLRGWDETTSEEVYGYLTSREGPLGGSIMKKAEGRSSKADDPIATIAMMADAAIRQGNRNVMKQRFLNFVSAHPTDLVSRNELWLQHNDATGEWVPVFPDLKDGMTQKEIEEELRLFEEKIKALAESAPDHYKRGREARNIPYKVVKGALNEHQVMVKRNGRTYILTINGNPRAAQALNGLTNPDVEQNGVVGNILKLGQYVNRQLSAFYTTRNPDFVAGNFLRDMLYSNCMTWVKESPRYALRFHRNFGRVNPFKLYSLIKRWERGELDDNRYLDKRFREFMLNGGETGYTSVKDIEGHKRTIARELRNLNSRNIGGKAWRVLGMQLELLNRSAENCARFAAYLTSREMGYTIDRSIYDAKEISVNFNKKGSGGKMVNATGQTFLGKLGSYLSGGGRIAYVFWNAGTQGMTNFIRAGKRHPVKALGGTVALFTLGTIMPLLAQMMSGDGDDDDKNAYYNLPEYVRRSNICINAGEQWITIPLPIEHRAIYGLGEMATGVVTGKEGYSNAELTRQIAAQISQLLPLDMMEGGGGLTPLIPSAVKPLTEAYVLNKGWTGMPVYRETPFNAAEPEWTKAYASADQSLVGFSKWLNEKTGGDDYKKGAIDINPAKIEYLLNGTFGGLISFPMKMKKTFIDTPMGKAEFQWSNTPILNRVVKSGDERTANRKLQNEYFNYLQEYKETSRLVKHYEDDKDKGILGAAEKINFLHNSDEYLRYEIFDFFKPDIDAIRRELKEASSQNELDSLKIELNKATRQLVDSIHSAQ